MSPCPLAVMPPLPSWGDPGDCPVALFVVTLRRARVGGALAGTVLWCTTEVCSQMLCLGQPAVIPVLAVGWAVVPPQTQNLSWRLFDSSCVSHPGMNGGITLNSGRCRAGLVAAIPSDSDKTQFLLKPLVLIAALRMAHCCRAPLFAAAITIGC